MKVYISLSIQQKKEESQGFLANTIVDFNNCYYFSKILDDSMSKLVLVVILKSICLLNEDVEIRAHSNKEGS